MCFLHNIRHVFEICIHSSVFKVSEAFFWRLPWGSCRRVLYTPKSEIFCTAYPRSQNNHFWNISGIFACRKFWTVVPKMIPWARGHPEALKTDKNMFPLNEIIFKTYILFVWVTGVGVLWPKNIPKQQESQASMSSLCYQQHVPPRYLQNNSNIKSPLTFPSAAPLFSPWARWTIRGTFKFERVKTARTSWALGTASTRSPTRSF